MKKVLSLIIVLVIFSNCSGQKSNGDLLKEKANEVITAFKKNSPENLKSTIANDSDLNKILLGSKNIFEGRMNEYKRDNKNIGNVSFLKNIKSGFKGTEEEWKNIKSFGFMNNKEKKYEDGRFFLKKIYFTSKDNSYFFEIIYVFFDGNIFLVDIKNNLRKGMSKATLEKYVDSETFKKDFEFIKL